MSAVNLIAVFAENQLGQMARITKALADAGVNIRWVTIATNTPSSSTFIFIQYNSSQFGVIDIKTGDFTFRGQG